jgi:winged helix DNA-binding protein
VWLGSWHEADPGEALAEVFRRYLRAYGPATPRDFAQWFNVPPAAARDLAARISGELKEVDVEGYRALVLAGDKGVAEMPEELPVRLLPHFDCYSIGCHPRDRLLPPDWAQRVPPRTTPGTLQVLLVEGKIAGIWERQAKGKRVDVRVQLFGSLDRRQKRLLEEEARRVGEVLEGEATLEIGPVAVRPHL